MKKRPYTLTIAGFDPCAGAGVLADIKTFEQLKTYSMAVITANTIQHESQFFSTEWISLPYIQQQLEVLAQKYTFEYIKIGLVQDLMTLNRILEYLHTQWNKPKIIWDPILKASAGFQFHTHIDKNTLSQCLKYVYLITPNYLEIQQLYPNHTIREALLELSKYCNVILKGGHNPEQPYTDILFTTQGKKYVLKPNHISLYAKHGSGCVFSSAVTAYMARGYPLLKATIRAKTYVTRFLNSSNTLLGLHK